VNMGVAILPTLPHPDQVAGTWILGPGRVMSGYTLAVCTGRRDAVKTADSEVTA